MKLHESRNDFEDLTRATARWRGIPAGAVRRDYYIVLMLQKLEKSEYSDQCVFKGGTSLSKCYPGSIERFSEDIDLTYITDEELNNKQYSKRLKKIETIMSEGGSLEKIPEERNDRNKSAFVWFDEIKPNEGLIKLEIGSSIRPDPFEKRSLTTYIQDFLDSKGYESEIKQYDLEPVTLNTLCIERTFLDKVMSVKRHALCGTLYKKVRHIYDVAQLIKMREIQSLLNNQEELKRLIVLTKNTDSYYLQKRNTTKDYDPTGPYSFDGWKYLLDGEIEKRYSRLHEDLLYTDEKQDLNNAIIAFERIDAFLKEIGE